MNKDFINKLLCPTCGSGLKVNVAIIHGQIKCQKCKRLYETENEILLLTPNKNKKYDHWDKEWKMADLQETIDRINRALSNHSSLLGYYTLARLAKRNNIKKTTTLEIGSGSGSYSLILKKLGLVKEVTLCDISLESLFYSKKLFEFFGEDCNLILADGLNLPFKKNAFDLTLSGGLIEHFKDDERLKIISEHLRVAPTALIQVPLNNPLYWLYRTLLTIYFRGWPFGMEVPYSKKELEKIIVDLDGHIVDLDYHNLLTSFVFMKLKKEFSNIFFKNIFKYEIGVLIKKQKQKNNSL